MNRDYLGLFACILVDAINALSSKYLCLLGGKSGASFCSDPPGESMYRIPVRPFPVDVLVSEDVLSSHSVRCQMMALSLGALDVPSEIEPGQ